MTVAHANQRRDGLPLPCPSGECVRHRGVVRCTKTADRTLVIEPTEDEVLKVGAYEIAVPGPRGTFVSFGDVALCRRHARARGGPVMTGSVSVGGRGACQVAASRYETVGAALLRPCRNIRNRAR